MEKLSRIILTVGIVLAAGLTALEVGLRLRDRAIGQPGWQRGLMTSEAERGWIGRPHAARWIDTGEYAVFVENDGEGYRRPYPLPPSSPIHSVLLLGGSTAWGRGVGRGELASDWLQRERPATAEVHNRAIDGYSLSQIQRTLERVLEERDFDEVVLLLSPADAASRSGPDEAPRWRVAVEDWSFAARLLSAQWDRFYGKTSRSSSPAALPDPPNLDETVAAIADRVHTAASRLVLVYAPGEADVGTDPERQHLRDAFARAARDDRVDFLDLSDAFRSTPHGHAPLFLPGSGLWSQRAQFLAAQILADSDLLDLTRPRELSAEAVRIGPHHPDLVYAGRVDRSHDSAVVFDWPGVSIHASVEAQSARFLLRSEKGMQYFNVVVDGKRRFVSRVTPTGRPIDIADLGPGAHEIVIRKRNDPSSPVWFSGIQLSPGGRTLPPPSLPVRHIEVIGASVACGHGNEGHSFGWENRGAEGRYCPDVRRLTDAGSTFGAVLGEWFDADVHLLAEGGRGLLRSYGESDPRSDRTLPVIIPRTLATRPGVWDRNGWLPDVVIVGIGENDLANKDGLEPAVFLDEYVRFLEDLRSRRPEAFFVLVNDGDQEGLCQIVREVAAVRSEAGEEYLATICYPDPPRRNKGCDRHPSAAGHVEIAQLIADEIERVMGWSRRAETR